MELSRTSSKEQLAAYLQANHELLVALLPADTWVMGGLGAHHVRLTPLMLVCASSSAPTLISQ